MKNALIFLFKHWINKYQEFKNNFNVINEENKIIEDDIIIDEYCEEIVDHNYFVKSKIKNYTLFNEIKFDIIFEEGDIKKPRIVGTLINKNRPSSWEIDIYSQYGQKYGRFGRRIIVEINDVSLYVDFNFDLISNKASFNTKTNFGEYIIKNYFYESKEIKESQTIGTISFPLPSRCYEIDSGIPEGEKELEIINAKKIETKMIINF